MNNLNIQSLIDLYITLLIKIQVHTPPGSNKSSAGTEDTKRCTTLNQPNIGCVRPEELSKMFPTPPSLEHHPSSSPCGGAISEPQMEIIDSPNYGSPVEEPIEVCSHCLSRLLLTSMQVL